MSAPAVELVELLPPLTRGFGRTDALPLQLGPRFVRTAAMGRWHRVRSGVYFERWGHTSWTLWCGQHATQGGRSGDCLAASEPFDGAPVCGTCEGRAIGAGQIPGPDGQHDLVFAPRRLDPPKRCPGSGSERLWVEIPEGFGVGRCLACGLVAAVRGCGGPYNPRVGLIAHAPGPGLVPGCPFHGWANLARRGSPEGPVARCGCNEEGAASWTT